MNVAVITARGGSKRIPRKNIKDFCGKPMIAYSIEAAKVSRLFERIIVSTDDAEIVEVAKSHGAEVPFLRPESLSDDHTGTTEVVAHAVEWMQNEGWNPEAVCCIYATAPFIKAEDLSESLKLFESGNWQFVFSATTFSYPIFRSFQIKEGGGIEMYFPEYFETRSQDFPEVIHDAAQFYWGYPEAWLQQKRIFDKKSTVFILPHWRVQDIDLPEDWERAELIYRILEKMKKENQDQIDYYLSIIDEIEKVRTRNNVNWMDILRLAFKHAPEEARELMRRVDSEDSTISSLLKKLTED